MWRRSSTPLLAVVMALVIAPAAGAKAPCSYEQRIVDISDSIVILGEDVGGALENAGDKTDAQLARQFGSFGRRMRRNERRVRTLAAPDPLRDLHSAFSASIPPIRRDLFGIARAARNHDAPAARTWTARLVDDSPALRRSRRALVRRAKARLRADSCD